VIIEYGKFYHWAKSLIFQAKLIHHDKWMADGYGYLNDVMKEHYAPRLTAEIFRQSDYGMGDRIQIPLNQGDESEKDIIPLARHKFLDKVDQDWED